MLKVLKMCNASPPSDWLQQLGRQLTLEEIFHQNTNITTRPGEVGPGEVGSVAGLIYSRGQNVST
jgi:hypothetical protein